MKSSPFGRGAWVAALLVGCLIAACETLPPDFGATENQLAAAGFIMKPADTPQRQTMLSRLPPHQFLLRQNAGTTHYVYADPLVCDCLYVGTQQAYDQYRTSLLSQQLADERQLAAIAWADGEWAWPAWGPWEAADASFGFTYGAAGW